MRRFGATLAGGLLLVGLLIGPGAGAASGLTVGPTVATGWVCHPNGSGVVGSPSTTLSIAVISLSTPQADSITCVFLHLIGGGATSAIQNGGDCYYHESLNIGVEFAHRLYVVNGSTATLFCWGGSQVAG